jgi:TolA-binding protein
MERRARVVGTLLVALMAVVAGCGGAAQSGGGAGDGAAAEERADATQAESTALAADSGGSDEASSVQSIDSRALVRTGRIELEVTDFERTERNLTQLVESRDGFVSDTQQQQRRVGDRTYLVGEMVLRVPNERFSATFADVQEEGEVLQSSTSTEDVTEQLVDIEARLDNLRAQRDRLRALYENANDTEAVLQVERRLSEVQTEIERLEARKQALERRVAYSTITVEIREERPDRLGVDEKWYDIGFVGAFLESVDGVVVAATAAVVLVGYALPYFLAVFLPIGALGSVVAWRRGWGPFGRRAEVVPEPPSSEADAEQAEDTEGAEVPGEAESDGDGGAGSDGDDDRR